MKLLLCIVVLIGLAQQVTTSVRTGTEEQAMCPKLHSESCCVKETKQNPCNTDYLNKQDYREQRCETLFRPALNIPTFWTLLNKSKSHTLALFMLTLLPGCLATTAALRYSIFGVI
uniref:Uncharacterized LOC113474184 n=1 Tax=Ciona intestinalis TaxID=7719 RepID=H2Y2A5_CIOIN|nr:uncharacterized protein LOC113474184 [Ciona intestinalis]|eukprot:XP_026689915.1 uncharacterized protein LOC113474184 [Ciona intestinalis]